MKLKALKLYVARCKEFGCLLTLYLGKPRKTSEGCWEGGPNAQSLMNLNLNRFPSVKPGKCREVALFDVVELKEEIRSEALWRRVSKLKNGEPTKVSKPVNCNGRVYTYEVMKKAISDVKRKPKKK